MTESDAPAPVEVIDVDLEDVDAAAEAGGRLYYPQRLTSLAGTSAVSMSVRAGRLGPLLLGELTYDSDVRIECGELVSSYHVNLPLTGRVATSHRGHDAIATPDRAAVYGPEGPTVLSRWESGSRQLCLKIDRWALESSLSAQLGRELARPVEFEPELDVGAGPGRGWRDLVLFLHDQIHRRGGLAHQPLTAAPLVDALLNGLLSSVGHRDRDDLVRSDSGPTASVVRRALDYFHDRAAEPVTVSDVAAHCCVSVRTLQEAFAREVGRTPMAGLRRIRLWRAHDELIAADPTAETVSRVAHRWGFTNPGRFAAAYGDEFGEPPAVTLRRSGPVRSRPAR